MSIKTKMQSLISAANAETGKDDTDLTTAVQSLISESGGITPSGNKAITATTSTQTDIDVTNYATVSVAPTPSETKSVTTNGDVTPSSGKLLSKVTVNVPTGEARNASDLTVSGATVNVPAGLYSSAASKSVASGTAGTPTASKGAVSNNSVTVTPSVANTTGYITGGTKTGAGVTVSASELVSGNKAITPSETAQSGIDVANFKTVSVGAISSTYVGSGVTKKAASTVAPSTSEQTVCASGVYTTGEQKVSAITPSIVGNLDASSFAASIVAAIEGKGVTVPDGTLLDGMAALIESIQTGGGGGDFNFEGYLGITKATSGTYTVTQDTKAVYINHGLGETPKIALALPEYDPSVTTDYRGFGFYSCILPSLDYYLSVTFRVNGTSNFLRGSYFEFMKTSAIGGYLDTNFQNTRLNKTQLIFGVNNSTNIYTILAGTTFHWIAMA